MEGLRNCTNVVRLDGLWAESSQTDLQNMDQKSQSLGRDPCISIYFDSVQPPMMLE